MSAFCIGSDAAYVAQLPEPERTAWVESYLYAIRTWGVWKEGHQVIGCRDHLIVDIQKDLENDLKEALK